MINIKCYIWRKNCVSIAETFPTFKVVYEISEASSQRHRLDRERYFFVASRSDTGDKKAVQLKHSTLTRCMTRLFERTGLFEGKKEIYKRVSCSRIRFSVITELRALGEDSLDNIEYCFGKHSKEVCKKF